jgi:cardiolipin synthase A/B
VNAFIYNEEQSKQLTEIFQRDMNLSSPLTLEDYQKRPLKIQFKEAVSRLLSPIL